jgi:hypothetical protein
MMMMMIMMMMILADELPGPGAEREAGEDVGGHGAARRVALGRDQRGRAQELLRLRAVPRTDSRQGWRVPQGAVMVMVMMMMIMMMMMMIVTVVMMRDLMFVMLRLVGQCRS